MKLLQSKYALLASFVLFFVSTSLLLRLIFTVLSWQSAALSGVDILAIFARGFLYDLSVALFFVAPYAVYLAFLPRKWNNTIANKTITYTAAFLAILVSMFSFFAEFTFWKEFDSRFNFIAVDYLIYTYEVVNNINQSYPLPYLVGGMLLLSALIIWILHKSKAFYYTYHNSDNFSTSLKYTAAVILLTTTSLFLLNNNLAEGQKNRYRDELSKAGIYSFFAALKSNELDYDAFYIKRDKNYVFSVTRAELNEKAAVFENPEYIRREISDSGTADYPNVIMVTIESFSASFMKRFGSNANITPTLDSIARKSIMFTDMYATGTRTVRGMEALSLSIPPTPGNSIVRRSDNANLYCIGSVFSEKGYTRTFFYGGDGYFDNMNEFFGNNGFDIVDRGSKMVPGEKFSGTRTRISDKYVHFENAWGICDEDLYDAVIRKADKDYANGQRFYDFVMTTSNHRPFTYPEGKIDIRSGTGRDGAVKYTDYAIGRFLDKIKSRPWFTNTVIIFVADHCASVAGKNEINVEHYHIPCMIYHPGKLPPAEIAAQCSQIDLYPTLFGLLNWDYKSNFYGKDVLAPDYSPRAFVATYQKLGLLSAEKLVVLSPGRQASEYSWNHSSNSQTPTAIDNSLLDKTISYYQSAFYLYKHEGLKYNRTNAYSNNTRLSGTR